MIDDGTPAADVAIIDLGLPDGYGGDLIKDLHRRDPQTQALVVSGNLDRAEVARAVESGAAGVLHKSVGMDDVVDAVRRVGAGEMLLPWRRSWIFSGSPDTRKMSIAKPASPWRGSHPGRSKCCGCSPMAWTVRR